MSSNQIPQGDQELEIENKKLENETKEEINPKKSKFNILEQGKFMLLTGENSSE